MSDAKYLVSGIPHIRGNSSTQKIMLDFVIALIPAICVHVYFFGLRALITVVSAVAACVFFEFAFQKIRKQKTTISDGSAVVTGVLLALILPASVNIAMPIAGSFFAIVIVKQLFGGIGSNFLNPALGAKVFLIMSYSSHVLITVHPVRSFGNISYVNINALALLLGGLYLLIRKNISWRTPVFFILTTVLLVWVFGPESSFREIPVYGLLAGGLVIGAFFMATDYATSPVTPIGKIIMGVGCGLVTALMHLFGNASEGMIYAVLFMNLTVPLIDRFTKPAAFGKARKPGGNKS